MAAALQSPAPPTPHSRRPSLLARTESPARGLGGPKSAVARVPGFSAAASGRGGVRGGARGRPCLPLREGVQRSQVGGWQGLMGFGHMRAMRDAWRWMDQSAVPFFPNLRGFSGCGTFNANIETVVSNLGSWSP